MGPLGMTVSSSSRRGAWRVARGTWHVARGMESETGYKVRTRRIREKSRTHGHNALKRIPSRAWTMASSRVMASTAPLDAVSVCQ